MDYQNICRWNLLIMTEPTLNFNLYVLVFILSKTFAQPGEMPFLALDLVCNDLLRLIEDHLPRITVYKIFDKFALLKDHTT